MGNAFDDDDWADASGMQADVGFEADLMALRDAYYAARNSVTSRLDRVMADQSKLEAEHESAGHANKWDDADGDAVDPDWINRWDGLVYLGEERQHLAAILPPIYEAFTIALFHFWEKKVTLLGGEKVRKGGVYDHGRAIGFLKTQGWTPDAGALTLLQLTANVAKHSSGTSATRLVALKPSFFSPEAQRSLDLVGHETLRLTHDILHTFFIAVERSGPR